MRTHARTHARTQSRESAILRCEINWNNVEYSCSLPTRRSEEFVNDRKAARSYLRTHVHSLSAPVNNLYGAAAACASARERAYMDVRVRARSHVRVCARVCLNVTR